MFQGERDRRKRESGRRREVMKLTCLQEVFTHHTRCNLSLSPDVCSGFLLVAFPIFLFVAHIVLALYLGCFFQLQRAAFPFTSEG